MKMFLSSVFADSIDKFINRLDREPKDLRVLFIPTAADTYDDKWFVDKDRDALLEKGFQIKELDIKNKTKEELEKEVKDIDIIFIAGGNTFYLSHQVSKSGFDKIIKDSLENGIIYVGSSAGSVLMCPTIEPVALIDDPSVVELDNYDGLGLFNKVILPHLGEEKHKEELEQIQKDFSNLEFIVLKDNQAVVVDDRYEVI